MMICYWDKWEEKLLPEIVRKICDNHKEYITVEGIKVNTMGTVGVVAPSGSVIFKMNIKDEYHNHKNSLYRTPEYTTQIFFECIKSQCGVILFYKIDDIPYKYWYCLYLELIEAIAKTLGYTQIMLTINASYPKLKEILEKDKYIQFFNCKNTRSGIKIFGYIKSINSFYKKKLLEEIKEYVLKYFDEEKVRKEKREKLIDLLVNNICVNTKLDLIPKSSSKKEIAESTSPL